MSDYPNDIHPDYPVATVYGADGVPVDYVGHHEPARGYAASGYRVVVHTGNGPYSHAELQDAVEREYADSQTSTERAS